MRGTGTHQGYVTFIQGGDQHVAKWSGKVSTVLDADQAPVTTFEGKWIKVKGPNGQGTYQGRLTGADTYMVEWQGEVELSQRAAR